MAPRVFVNSTSTRVIVTPSSVKASRLILSTTASKRPTGTTSPRAAIGVGGGVEVAVEVSSAASSSSELSIHPASLSVARVAAGSASSARRYLRLEKPRDAKKFEQVEHTGRVECVNECLQASHGRNLYIVVAAQTLGRIYASRFIKESVELLGILTPCHVVSEPIPYASTPLGVFLNAEDIGTTAEDIGTTAEDLAAAARISPPPAVRTSRLGVLGTTVGGVVPRAAPDNERNRAPSPRKRWT